MTLHFRLTLDAPRGGLKRLILFVALPAALILAGCATTPVGIRGTRDGGTPFVGRIMAG